MRIALVIAGPFPALRGSQVLVRHLAHGLEARGHAVVLVTYGRRLRDRPGLHPARPLLDVALLVRLLRVVRRERIDVIHAHNYEAAIAGLVVARLTGRPLVYHGHSALAEELPTYGRSRRVRSVLAWLGGMLDAHVPRRADFCIAVTDELGARLRAAGVATNGLACIAPTGMPAEVHAYAAGEGDGALVCYAGNLDGYQNLAFLAESFARVRASLPDARLVLVTHEGGRAAAARHLAAGFEIVEAESYAAMQVRLAAAQVAVCPRTEGSGFPMKLLNYMAAGKAIVACRGSAKGLVDGETACVVPDGDAAAFAGAITALLGDPVERARLGGAARAAIERGDAWERVLDEIEDIYDRIVSGDGRVLVPATCVE